MSETIGQDKSNYYLIGFIVFAIVATLCFYHFALEWEEEEIDNGYSSQARKNDFLAAELFLKKYDVELERSRGFSRIDSLSNEQNSIATDDTIIILNGRGMVRGRRLDKLWQWVEGGGNLIVSTYNPFIGTEASDELLGRLEIEYYIDEEQYDELDDEIEQYPTENIEDYENSEDSDFDDEEIDEANRAEIEQSEKRKSYKCDSWDLFELKTSDSGGIRVDFRFRGEEFWFPEGSENFAMIADDSGYASAGFNIGRGNIIVNKNNHIWKNKAIDNCDHAYLLLEWSKPSKKVWIIENQNAPSLLSIFWVNAPNAIIALLAALIFWLWRISIRHGPLFQPAKIERRSFAEHIRASAVFLWRNKNQFVLIDQLRNDIAYAMQRKNWHYENMSEEEKINQFTSLSGLEADSIYLAMFKPSDEIDKDFVRVINRLKFIKDCL